MPIYLPVFSSSSFSSPTITVGLWSSPQSSLARSHFLFLKLSKTNKYDTKSWVMNADASEESARTYCVQPLIRLKRQSLQEKQDK